MTEIDIFMNACENNDIDTVKNLVNSIYDIDKHHNGNGFSKACRYGHIEIVKYLALLYRDYMVASKNCSGESHIGWSVRDGFLWACINGNMEIIKYLAVLYRYINKNDDMFPIIDINAGFLYGCRGGYINVINYLVLLYKNYISSINYNVQHNYKMVKINYGVEPGFKMACKRGYINIVFYLINLYKKTNYKPINIYAEIIIDYNCTTHNHITKYIANLGNHKTSHIKIDSWIGFL